MMTMAQSSNPESGLSLFGEVVLKGVTAPDIEPYGSKDHTMIGPRQEELYQKVRQVIKTSGLGFELPPEDEELVD